MIERLTQVARLVYDQAERAAAEAERQPSYREASARSLISSATEAVIKSSVRTGARRTWVVGVSTT